MTISLLHPSRGRPQKALATFTNWMNKASGLHKIEHILSIDTSDPCHNAYKNQDYPYGISKILAGNNTCAVEATNKAATLSVGDILIMLSDDFDCPQDWDNLIVEAFAGKRGAVLKTFDGLQPWIVTLAIMDRAYYEMQFLNGNKQPYFYYPEYQHMFCDTDMTHKADLEGRLIIRNDLIFPHNHYARGKSKKDATNERADKTIKQGEAVYLRRIAGLAKTGTDVFKLAPEAKQHVQWLKMKMRVAA